MLVDLATTSVSYISKTYFGATKARPSGYQQQFSDSQAFLKKRFSDKRLIKPFLVILLINFRTHFVAFFIGNGLLQSPLKNSFF